MRSIAHDLGLALGCGAHLADLRRMASGEFELAQVRTIPQLGIAGRRRGLLDALIPAGQMLPRLHSVFVDDLTPTKIRNGRNFSGIAMPFAAGLPLSKGDLAAGRTGGDRRGRPAECLPSGGGAVTPGESDTLWR
jgi:tRNA pseudouridine55 synthase